MQHKGRAIAAYTQLYPFQKCIFVINMFTCNVRIVIVVVGVGVVHDIMLSRK